MDGGEDCLRYFDDYRYFTAPYIQSQVARKERRCARRAVFVSHPTWSSTLANIKIETWDACDCVMVKGCLLEWAVPYTAGSYRFACANRQYGTVFINLNLNLNPDDLNTGNWSNCYSDLSNRHACYN